MGLTPKILVVTQKRLGRYLSGPGVVWVGVRSSVWFSFHHVWNLKTKSLQRRYYRIIYTTTTLFVSLLPNFTSKVPDKDLLEKISTTLLVSVDLKFICKVHSTYVFISDTWWEHSPYWVFGRQKNHVFQVVYRWSTNPEGYIGGYIGAWGWFYTL